MFLDKMCGPAILYLGFSFVHIIIDYFNNEYRRVLIELCVMTVFTIFLQLLCMKGLSFVSWIIVFIPFLFFTYITSIILFVFGLKPKADNLKYNVHDKNTNQRTNSTSHLTH